ncbi:MAG: DNA-binding domain-containing protein [Oceanibaculum nanhaiense]|uniref:HvfC/BufC N-terminal domain-containing protein n=1 Tax=Oceanibaculum nanhaiense TaxID=1909734 RepID=UPI0025A34C45|nr:DNA-binding domain-containing protein [Oceanibaculum nanhaiense]MDM7945574.1 DNA-binding domain-containing protein [Oceanibaculum nanhaiense]
MPEANMLEAQQAGFAAALRRQDAPPAGLVGDPQGRHPLTRRFAVYLNNVHHGLTQTLADAFPVVRRLVGEEFFFAMARLYGTENLPRTRGLTHYGDRFPAFLYRFPPARTLPYLADVARLERAALEVLHAADAPAATPEQLLALGESLAETPLPLNPAVRLVASRHPVLAIHAANSGDATGDGEIADRPQSVLIYRDGPTVRLIGIEPAELHLLRRLKTSWSLARIAETCPPQHAGAGLVVRFQRLAALPIFTLPTGDTA